MSDFSPNVLYYGTDLSLPTTLTLRAGSLNALYEAGSLRYIRLGTHSVLHQIYAAVRDHNWGTVPGQLQDIQIEQRADSFTISYTSEHHQHDVHFQWRGQITGSADSTIIFSMEGEALSTFKRNRIGFCVLHPTTCAGLPCAIEHVDGSHTEGSFPLTISPHQPFFNIRAITHEVIPGVRAEVRMEGDTFEMEDQRNWTDASYKTYCTPLGLPFPVTVETGTRINQTITLRLIGSAPRFESTSGTLAFTIGTAAAALPPLGLCAASHNQPLTAAETERLKALNLSHLRADVRLDQPDYEARLRQTAAETQALGAGLEIALHLPDNADTRLPELRRVLDDIRPVIARWLVFCKLSQATQAVQLVRQHLGQWAEAAPLGAGTDAFFTELNRNRPPLEELALVSYSINPTVHAVDNASLVETLAVQGDTVRSARAFSNNLPVVVSPITFRMRWNPNATGAEPSTPPGELPGRVDPRQMSLFGAGWTLGSIKYLAESGVAALTYYETTGWLGVMETLSGSPVPDKFRSIPGGVFPMYHVFSDVGDYRGGQIIASVSSDSLTVDGLVLRRDDQMRILLANFSQQPQTLAVTNAAGKWSVKSLDETNAISAMRDPEGWRAQAGVEIEADNGTLYLSLLPFALVRADSMQR